MRKRRSHILITCGLISLHGQLLVHWHQSQKPVQQRSEKGMEVAECQNWQSLSLTQPYHFKRHVAFSYLRHIKAIKVSQNVSVGPKWLWCCCDITISTRDNQKQSFCLSWEEVVICYVELLGSRSTGPKEAMPKAWNLFMIDRLRHRYNRTGSLATLSLIFPLKSKKWQCTCLSCFALWARRLLGLWFPQG